MLKINIPLLIILTVLVILTVALYYIYKAMQFQKTKNKIKAFIENLKAGDYVLLSSGIYGQIIEIKNEIALVQIAENVQIQVNRYFIESKALRSPNKG